MRSKKAWNRFENVVPLHPEFRNTKDTCHDAPTEVQGGKSSAPEGECEAREKTEQ